MTSRIFTALTVITALLGCGQSDDMKSVLKTTSTRQLSEAMVYTTAQETDLRLTLTDTLAFEESRQPLEVELSVFVHTNKEFQEILGIGGAITDASAEVFAQLSDKKQEELLKAYFGPDGNNYGLLRTTIHSSDFSQGSYTYVTEGDTSLSSFSIAHDEEYRIPMIKRAIQQAGGELITYVSPWSPPAYMKTNGSMLKGGKLKPEFAPLWARYYAKFIKEYEAKGIPIWGLTIQNEPMATQRWESCIYTAEEERDFLKNHLGPTLAKAGLGDKKIIVWDHNRDLISQRAHTILDDPDAAKYVWGVGFHWYETWTGSAPMFENLGKVKASFPETNLMFTEGCNEKFDPEKYESWPLAERYGRSMINDFNQGTTGWTDWNILLNNQGGPNHVGNFCFAPIHADLASDSLIYTPAYYYMGHFSRFLQKNARRISASSSLAFVETTAFKNADGTVAIVMLNTQDQPLEINLYVDDKMTSLKMPPRALQTVLIK